MLSGQFYSPLLERHFLGRSESRYGFLDCPSLKSHPFQNGNWSCALNFFKAAVYSSCMRWSAWAAPRTGSFSVGCAMLSNGAIADMCSVLAKGNSILITSWRNREEYKMMWAKRAGLRCAHQHGWHWDPADPHSAAAFCHAQKSWGDILGSRWSMQKGH